MRLVGLISWSNSTLDWKTNVPASQTYMPPQRYIMSSELVISGYNAYAHISIYILGYASCFVRNNCLRQGTYIIFSCDGLSLAESLAKESNKISGNIFNDNDNSSSFNIEKLVPYIIQFWDRYLSICFRKKIDLQCEVGKRPFQIPTNFTCNQNSLHSLSSNPFSTTLYSILDLLYSAYIQLQSALCQLPSKIIIGILYNEST